MLNSRAYHVFSLLLFMMTNTVAMWEEICIQISIQLKQIPTYHKKKKIKTQIIKLHTNNFSIQFLRTAKIYIFQIT